MRVNRGLLGWGVFFIALGAVPLAVQGGAISSSTARRAWELWPLLLVGAGLGLALRRTALAGLGGLVVALTLGLMAGGFAAGGLGGAPFAICSPSGAADSGTQTSASGSLAADASVSVTVDCGTLEVTTQPGSDWSVAWPGPNSPQPLVRNPSAGRLSIEFGQRSTLGIGATTARWSAVLPKDPSLRLDLTLNAGSSTVSLAGAHVASLDASVNAGDATLDLGSAIVGGRLNASVNAGSLGVTLPSPEGTLTGSFTANAGTIRICAPASVPIRIQTGDNALGTTNFALRGMTQNGNTWTRGAWDGATSRIDLRVSANLGTVDLDPEGGCG